MALHVLILNGPNLNLLGTRETDKYGTDTLESINDGLRNLAVDNNIELKILQSNHEGSLVDAIQEYAEWADWCIFNPAAYTHTSLAIHDALLATRLRTIEVHLTNIHNRESFRHNSFVSSAAVGQIAGFGKWSYYLALQYIIGVNKKEGTS